MQRTDNIFDSYLSIVNIILDAVIVSREISLIYTVFLYQSPENQ